MAAGGLPIEAGGVTTFEERALLFKALGHPTRLAIVDALADGERDVSSIRGLVGSDLSTISRHLLQLKTSGVLASRRDGKQIFYRLRTPCVVTVLHCVTTIVDDAPPQGVVDASSSATPCGSICRETAVAPASHAPATTKRPARSRVPRR